MRARRSSDATGWAGVGRWGHGAGYTRLGRLSKVQRERRVPLREIIGKATAFGLVSLACIGGGFFAFYGSHSYNDYVSIYLPFFLWIVGVGVGGLGALLVLG